MSTILWNNPVSEKENRRGGRARLSASLQPVNAAGWERDPWPLLLTRLLGKGWGSEGPTMLGGEERWGILLSALS